MKKEKLFLINDSGQWSNYHIVKATSKKEALDKIWKDYYVGVNESAKEYGFLPVFKCELEVIDLEKELKDENYYTLD